MYWYVRYEKKELNKLLERMIQMQVSNLSIVKSFNMMQSPFMQQQQKHNVASPSAASPKTDIVQIGLQKTTEDIGIYKQPATTKGTKSHLQTEISSPSTHEIYHLSDGQALTKEHLHLAETKGTLSMKNEITIHSLPNKIIEKYTGHAAFDNAITDALQGKSKDLKEQVYDILGKNFFPAYANDDISESDRQAMIGLGLAQAEYLANQHFDADTKKSFMEAMTGLARIATQGTKNPDGTMQYDISNVVQLDGNRHVMPNQMQEILYTMKKESPEDFDIYKNLKQDSMEKSSDFAWKWLWQSDHLQLMFQNRTEYEKAQQKYYEDLKSVSLDQTFANTDFSSKESFLASIQEQISKVDNPDFFMKFFQQMSKKI